MMNSKKYDDVWRRWANQLKKGRGPTLRMIEHRDVIKKSLRQFPIIKAALVEEVCAICVLTFTHGEEYLALRCCSRKTHKECMVQLINVFLMDQFRAALTKGFSLEVAGGTFRALDCLCGNPYDIRHVGVIDRGGSAELQFSETYSPASPDPPSTSDPSPDEPQPGPSTRPDPLSADLQPVVSIERCQTPVMRSSVVRRRPLSTPIVIEDDDDDETEDESAMEAERGDVTVLEEEDRDNLEAVEAVIEEEERDAVAPTAIDIAGMEIALLKMGMKLFPPLPYDFPLNDYPFANEGVEQLVHVFGCPRYAVLRLFESSYVLVVASTYIHWSLEGLGLPLLPIALVVTLCTGNDIDGYMKWGHSGLSVFVNPSVELMTSVKRIMQWLCLLYSNEANVKLGHQGGASIADVRARFATTTCPWQM